MTKISNMTTVNQVAEAHGWTVHSTFLHVREYRRAGGAAHEVRVTYTPKGQIRSAHRHEAVGQYTDVWTHETGKLAKVIELLGGVDVSNLTRPLTVSLGWYVLCEVIPGYALDMHTPQRPDTNQRAALVTRGLLTPGEHHHLTEKGRKAAIQLFPHYRQHVQSVAVCGCLRNPLGHTVDEHPEPPATSSPKYNQHVGGVEIPSATQQARNAAHQEA